MYLELKLFAPTPTQARLVALDNDAGITAAIWSSPAAALVLLIDHQAKNLGASVTNACESLIPLVFMMALGNRRQDDVRWFEHDSMGFVDEVVIDRWQGDDSVVIHHVPFRSRCLAGFERLIAEMPSRDDDPTAGYVVEKVVGQLVSPKGTR